MLVGDFNGHNVLWGSNDNDYEWGVCEDQHGSDHFPILIESVQTHGESNPVQSGFRSERSINDNLVGLETFIRDAFVAKEHVIAVFFDLDKAYDTTWRHGIMRDLHDLGIRGRLATFIENFLADRWIQVRVGSILSEKFDQAQGVQQGSILSTTLFSIKINSIMTCLDPKTDGPL